jgi:hypothetical protein
MTDYLSILNKFLDTYSDTFVLVEFSHGYGGNTLSRVISASPEFYWDGDPTEYPDEGYAIIIDPEPHPHFANPIQQELCCTHTFSDFMYPEFKKLRVMEFIRNYSKNIHPKKFCVRSHNGNTHEIFPKNTIVRISGKEPDFRFFKSTDRYKKPKQLPNVINIDVNEIFSKDYDTFEASYLDLCTKLDITPQTNRVRAFILLWLELQERYKKLKIS